METNTQPATALSIQEQALAKAKSSAEKKFELTIAETTAVVSQCKAIVITDTTTLAMANQILSKANNALKDVEEKRKNYNRPYADQIAFVNSLVKEKISNPLSEAVEHGKKLLREWNEKEIKKASDLKAENDKRFTFLKTCEANIQKQVDLCTTIENIDKLITVINKQWPTDDKFGSYIEEANKTKNNFIAILEMQKVKIQNAVSGDVEAFQETTIQVAEVVTEQAELSVVATEKKEIIAESIQAETSAVRRVWKWEVISEKDLPREFLSIDKAKVDAYMKANKEKFDEAGTVKAGVKFFRDAAPMIK